jgi:hypothetical protein
MTFIAVPFRQWGPCFGRGMEIIVSICAQPSLSDSEQSLDRRLYPDRIHIPFSYSFCAILCEKRTVLHFALDRKTLFEAIEIPFIATPLCHPFLVCGFFAYTVVNISNEPENNPPQFLCGMNRAY